MPRIIRFHLDEHVDPAVAAGLLRRGIEVSTSAEAGLLGADDSVQLAYVVSEQRVLCTSDSDFLNLHGQGFPHAGIAYYHQQQKSVGELIRCLELIWEVLEPSEMADRIEWL